MDKIQNLLDQIGIIDQKNAEISDATGARFNIFRVCGVDHYENTHSAILAELLNPSGTHGLRSQFLVCFIETLGSDFAIKSFNSDTARVFTEYSTEEGRIDIFIEDNQNKCIIIENKIYAKDQPDQLKRYDRYAKTHRKEAQIVYLTLFGNEASEQSSANIPYLKISYKEGIINWLEKCVAIASRFPIVRETIVQYINHLKQLTNQDMDKKNEAEIVAILSKIENLKAARAIFQNYSAVYNHLAKEYFNPGMEEYARQNGLEYHYERSEELYVRFYFTHSEWQGKYHIGFTFEGNKCHYGLCNHLKVYRLSAANREILHEKLNELGVLSRKESEWWPFYAHYPNLSVETWENDIVKSNRFMNDCKKKIEELLLAMKGIDF